MEEANQIGADIVNDLIEYKVFPEIQKIEEINILNDEIANMMTSVVIASILKESLTDIDAQKQKEKLIILQQEAEKVKEVQPQMVSEEEIQK